ncbi:hypothetical protein N7540_008456 [Penicillium herquei]|nr:hypothetical protein N7540_008456 [Penicillium herquei]
MTGGKSFMSILDAACCFYQWTQHPSAHGLIAGITHRGQEIFKVAIIGHKNSIAYVQRQMDNLLRELLPMGASLHQR